MSSRYRVERCAAHGIAVGLCESPQCKGSTEARGVGRQLVSKLKPPRCHSCEVERGDAIKRGKFYGAKGDHPGYQSYWCDDCWENKLKRDLAASTTPARASFRDRKAEQASRARRQDSDSVSYD
jgi:hypothetical protein